MAQLPTPLRSTKSEYDPLQAEMAVWDQYKGLLNLPDVEDRVLPPPGNPLTPMAAKVADVLGLTDAYRAVRGRMTEGEAQDFAFGAALGMLPMARGARPVFAAEKGLGSGMKGNRQSPASPTAGAQAPGQPSLSGEIGKEALPVLAQDMTPDHAVKSLVNYLQEAGVPVRSPKQSAISESRYLQARAPDGEWVKVRISDHDLPTYHVGSDIDVGFDPVRGARTILEAFGVDLPSRLKSAKAAPTLSEISAASDAKIQRGRAIQAELEARGLKRNSPEWNSEFDRLFGSGQ